MVSDLWGLTPGIIGTNASINKRGNLNVVG